MKKNKPVIMVVAGGNWQVPLIKKLRDLGAYVVNTNLYPDSIGFQYANVGLVADVKDIEENLKIAKYYQPDAILTDQSDIAVPTVAKLCEELGLPGIGYNIAMQFTNKVMMRDFCFKNNLPTPRYRCCQNESEVIDFIKEINKPVVIKPPDNQSSRGVQKIDDLASVHHAFIDAIRHTSSKQVLVEEYIEGTELTVEGIKITEKHITLAISEKHHYEHNQMIANRLLFSRENKEIDFDKLIKQHDYMIEAMQLPFGLTHTEYKYHNENFYLIETAARGGGTKISSHIVPLLSGVDTYKVLLMLAMGEKIYVDSINYNYSNSEKTSVLHFFDFEPGLVKKISGLEKARSLHGVIDLELNFKVGDMICQSSDDRSRHMHVIAYGKNTEFVLETARKAREQIEVYYG